MCDINDDDTVVDMFKMYRFEIVINLHVYDMKIISTKHGNTNANKNVQNT